MGPRQLLRTSRTAPRRASAVTHWHARQLHPLEGPHCPSQYPALRTRGRRRRFAQDRVEVMHAPPAPLLSLTRAANTRLVRRSLRSSGTCHRTPQRRGGQPHYAGERRAAPDRLNAARESLRRARRLSRPSQRFDPAHGSRRTGSPHAGHRTHRSRRTRRANTTPPQRRRSGSGRRRRGGRVVPPHCAAPTERQRQRPVSRERALRHPNRLSGLGHCRGRGQGRGDTGTRSEGLPPPLPDVGLHSALTGSRGSCSPTVARTARRTAPGSHSSTPGPRRRSSASSRQSR